MVYICKVCACKVVVRIFVKCVFVKWMCVYWCIWCIFAKRFCVSGGRGAVKRAWYEHASGLDVWNGVQPAPRSNGIRVSSDHFPKSSGPPEYHLRSIKRLKRRRPPLPTTRGGTAPARPHLPKPAPARAFHAYPASRASSNVQPAAAPLLQLLSTL